MSKERKKVDWKQLASKLLRAVDAQYSPACSCHRCEVVRKAAEEVRRNLAR